MKNDAHTVYLVDDDKDDRMFFSEALEELNSKITLRSFADGTELLQHLEQDSPVPPDLIFLDMNMPYIGGEECMVELRKRPAFKDVVIVLYSTYIDPTKTEGLKTNGADFYLNKPNSFTGLKETIHKFLQFISGNPNPEEELEFVVGEKN